MLKLNKNNIQSFNSGEVLPGTSKTINIDKEKISEPGLITISVVSMANPSFTRELRYRFYEKGK